jgi:hypothetical protein
MWKTLLLLIKWFRLFEKIARILSLPKLGDPEN